MELKPPIKPGKNATQKALNAYHSQLRRYHRMLEEWDAKLTQANEKLKAAIDQQIEQMTEDGDLDLAEMRGDELECGCTIADAKSGCECPDCDIWRDMEACRIKADKRAPEGAGDEVTFLEGLLKLKDERK